MTEARAMFPEAFSNDHRYLPPEDEEDYLWEVRGPYLTVTDCEVFTSVWVPEQGTWVDSDELAHKIARSFGWYRPG